MCSGASVHWPGDALQLREKPVEFLGGDLLDARGERPLVTEWINHCRHSIPVNSVACPWIDVAPASTERR